MKTVLILTDLSKNALNAAEAGLILAMQNQVNLLLFHSCVNLPIAASYPALSWINEEPNWLDESEKQLKSLAKHLQRFGERMYPHEALPTIQCEVGQGNMRTNIAAMVSKKQVELVVMGGRSGSPIDCPKPMLIVAQKKPMRKLDKLTFATNFKEEDLSAIQLLLKYGECCNFQLDIVHVKPDGDQEADSNAPMASFIKELSREQHPVVRFTEVGGKDLIPRLYAHCKETETDVLALTYQEDSAFVRLLKEGLVNKSISNQQLPLLILPK